MNTLAKKALEHLTEDGHYERKRALQDLINHGAFNNNATFDKTEAIIRDYVRDNPLALCKSGIDRFMQACGLKTPNVIDMTVRLTLDPAWPDYPVSSGNMGFTPDSQVGGELAEHIKTFATHSGRGFTQATVTSVKDVPK